jgi:hypothetical protein
LWPLRRVCARQALAHPPVEPKKAIVGIVKYIIWDIGHDMID